MRTTKWRCWIASWRQPYLPLACAAAVLVNLGLVILADHLDLHGRELLAKVLRGVAALIVSVPLIVAARRWRNWRAERC